MSRLSELEWMRDIARKSIEEADPEKRAALIAQLRAIVKEIAELGGSESAERSGLIDFQEALSKRRQPTAKSPRRAEKS